MASPQTERMRELNAKIVELIRVATELRAKNVKLRAKLAKMRRVQK